MAILVHPMLGTGGDAPTSCAELVIDTFVPPFIPSAGARIPHPDPTQLSSSGGSGGDSAVGYAS